MVNDLWAAGAEGIAVNGERLIGTTAIRSVATVMLVNARRIAPPLSIATIGDPDLLADFVLRPEGSLDRLKAFDFPVRVTQTPQVVLPAYRGVLAFTYARPAR